VSSQDYFLITTLITPLVQDGNDVFIKFANFEHLNFERLYFCALF